MSRATALPATRRPEFVETIFRRSQLEGKAHIMLGGRCVIMPGVALRGDLHRVPGPNEKGPVVAISTGRYTVIATGSVLKPPARITRGQFSYHQMKIGDNVFIGPNSVISSASIGSNVHIGANCVLSPWSMIKEMCHVLPDSIVPEGMVIPAGMVVGGRPARILGEVGEGWGAMVNGPDEQYVPGGDLRALVRSIK